MLLACAVEICSQCIIWRGAVFLVRMTCQRVLAQNHGDLLFSRIYACMSMSDGEFALQYSRERTVNSLELLMFTSSDELGDEYSFLVCLLHVGTCVSMVRKIPVCWRHLEFWETS